MKSLMSMIRPVIAIGALIPALGAQADAVSATNSAALANAIEINRLAVTFRGDQLRLNADLSQGAPKDVINRDAHALAISEAAFNRAAGISSPE